MKRASPRWPLPLMLFVLLVTSLSALLLVFTAPWRKKGKATAIYGHAADALPTTRMPAEL